MSNDMGGTVKIKPRSEILHDIIRDGKKHPKGWQVAFGNDSSSLSHDYYIFHPNTGIYLLKEYNKNPYEIKGLGSKLARHIDEDIQEQITKTSGNFGILQGDVQKILVNIQKGISAEKILSSAIHGDDLGLTIPVRGKVSTSIDAFRSLKNTFSSQQKKLTSHLEKMASDDGLYVSYD